MWRGETNHSLFSESGVSFKGSVISLKSSRSFARYLFLAYECRVTKADESRGMGQEVGGVRGPTRSDTCSVGAMIPLSYEKNCLYQRQSWKVSASFAYDYDRVQRYRKHPSFCRVLKGFPATVLTCKQKTQYTAYHGPYLSFQGSGVPLFWRRFGITALEPED